MTTVYPTSIDDWQDPQDGDALNTSPDGRDHQQHHTDLNAVSLAMETQLAGPTFTSSGAYGDTVASLIEAAEALSGSGSTWTAVNGHSGDTASLDAAIFTQGAASVTCDLNYPSGSGTNGKLYADLDVAVTVGTHTALTMDCRFHVGNGNGAQKGFRVAVSDAAALTGTLVSSPITQDDDTQDAWFTITVPLTGLSTVKSVGIEKDPTDAGSSAKWVTWWLDNIELRESTALDAALEDVDGAVVVPADYVNSVVQFTDTYSDVRAVLDLRTAHATHPGINGTYNLRDWRLDETGIRDVTEDLQRILDTLADGSTLLAPATGIFRIDDTVSVGTDQRNVTFDGQGSRWFQPTESNSPLFSLNGTENTIKGMRAFSLNVSGPNDADGLAAGNDTHPVVGTPTANGTTCELNAQLEQVELAWKTSKEIAFYARDHLGVNTWEFVLSDTNQVASDCQFTIMKPDGTVLQTTTQTLTGTPTTYAVTYTPTDLYVPLRVAVSKATATANTITITSFTMYGRQTYDANLAFNHFVSVFGDSCRVLDSWAEGMGGDMVTTGGAQGLYIENVNGRVVGRQGFSFNTGQWITLKNCECIGASRHALDFEPETSNVFVTDLTIEGCRFIDPGLGFIAATAWPHVRNVNMRNCDFIAQWGGTGPWFSGGWWGGTLSNCTMIRNSTGPFAQNELHMRAVHISDILASGGLELGTSNRGDENSLSLDADYVTVNGWRAYDPDILYSAAYTHCDAQGMVALDGSYREQYPI